MALQPTIVPLVFSQGINTKVDPKQQIIGSLRSARNVVFETINALRKRNGYMALPLRDNITNQQIEVERISKYKKEILLLNSRQLYSYSDTLEKVLEKGPLYTVQPKGQNILSSSSLHDKVDAITVAGFTVFVYHNDSADEVRYSVQDNASGSLLVSNDTVATSAQDITVAAINNTVFLIYASSATISYRSFNIYKPQTLTSPSVLANNYSSCLAAVGTTSKCVVAYNSTVVGNHVRVTTINSDGTAGTGTGVTSSAAVSVCLQVDSAERVIVAWSDATTVNYSIINFLFTFFILNPTVI